MIFLKRAVLTLVAVALFAGAAFAAYEWPPVETSKAYERYLNRPRSEMSRLIYLLDRFNFDGMEIRVDGTTYQAPMCVPFVKAYLALNYRKERAEVWIQKHVYRSPFTNEVMVGRLPGEDYRPGRDMLFEELAKLRKLEEASPA
jgi:hypothetical protein